MPNRQKFGNDSLPVVTPITEFAKPVNYGRGKVYNKTQKEAHLLMMTNMRLRGHSIPAIAKEMGISTGYAYKLFKEVEDDWRKQALVDINVIKGRELARIDAMEATAWDAWVRSQADTLKQQEDREVDIKGAFVATKKRATRQNEVGDARFLDIILKCIEARAKLLGLNNPETVYVKPVEDSDGRTGVSIETRVARYQGVLGVNVGVFANPSPHRDDPGEPVDSARSTPEANAVFDTTGRIGEPTS